MERPEFFKKHGVHLSDLGLDVFLEDVKGGLLVELEQCGGGCCVHPVSFVYFP